MGMRARRPAAGSADPGLTRLRRICRILWGAGLLLLAGGAVFLMVWEPKAPTHVIERTIPDDKLPK